MKVFLYIITILALSCHSRCYGDNSFGYLSYSTHNIGDDIQALAAKQFLPKRAIPIDREYLANFESDQPVKVLVNGWFMHTKSCWIRTGIPPNKSWPPPPSIDPLLISMHVTRSFFAECFSDESIQYLKEHGPVGARDLITLDELQKKGIPSYFSGCLSLTLKNLRNQIRKNVIYAVDVDNEIVNYIRSKTKTTVVVMSHAMFYSQLSNKQRLDYAERILDRYRQAKCVVTTRLHACLPCLAFETPVLLIADYVDRRNPRLYGLGNLAHHCSKDQLLTNQINFDFSNPPDNPKDYIPLRDNLIRVVENWVSNNMK